MLRVAGSLLVIALGASLAWGDVVTTVSGTSLVVTGDSSPNSIAITSALDGIAVVGFDGTLVDGSAQGVTVPGVQRLTVKLGKGSDRLTLTQLFLSGGLDLRLGRGHDSVQLDSVQAGATNIQTGNGYDFVSIFGASRFDRVSILTSNGNDVVELDGGWISGDLDVDTGSDYDDVTLVATHVGDDLSVEMGGADDFLLLDGVAVDDDTDLDGEDDDDVLVLGYYLYFGDELDIDGFDDDWWW